MKKYINIAAALVTVFAVFISCQREDILVPDLDMVPEGYISLEFKAEVPEMNTVQTKAVDPDGGGVQNITVFCFDRNSLFITTVKAEILSMDDSASGLSASLSGTFKVLVPDHTETVQLVGNQNLTYFKEDSYRGMSEVEVMANLEASAGRMIYWARRTIDELKVNNTAENSVKLIRNQAKFTLNVQTGVSFAEKGWIVVNTNAFGTVAPYCSEHGFEAPHFQQRPFVTLPENTAKLSDFLDVRTVAEEYVFETENTADSPVDFIVKGSQNGGPDLYYRISIVDQEGNYIPIYRNHHYTVNITGTLSYGQQTFAEALEAPATNNILVSVDDQIRQITDGILTLAVDDTFVVIGEDEFPAQPQTWYLHYTVRGSGAAQADVSWLEGNNVALNNFSHTFDASTGRGTILITLRDMGELKRREGTLLVQAGRLSRKINVMTVAEQTFVPAWITTNIYGGQEGQNVTMMFHIPDDCPQELFPMDVLVSVNDLDVRNASGMVLPVITASDSRYGEDNGIGYKYILTVEKPGVQRLYLKTILTHDTDDLVSVTIEADHFKTLTKTATFRQDTDYRILLHDIGTYVGTIPADEVIYYYMVPQKINAPVEFASHLGQVFKEIPADQNPADFETVTDALGTHYVKHKPANTDFAGHNVDEFLLYSENLDHNHDYSSSKEDYFFDFYHIDASKWSETAGRVMGFIRNGNQSTNDSPFFHLKTNKPKSDEVVRIASNPKGSISVTTGSPGEMATQKYVAPEERCTGDHYKSAVFELSTYHPFHFAATVQDAGKTAVGKVVSGASEEIEETVELTYVPGHMVELAFDVTSFKGNHNEDVDPFGTAFDIYIDAPMLDIDQTDPLYLAGKLTKSADVAGRYVYHVDASKDRENAYGAYGRKGLTFKTNKIVTSGEITISSDESKVVFYKKTFKVQNASIRGTVMFQPKDGNAVSVPEDSFVPFEMLPTYNRIGTMDVNADGAFELRLREEYKYDWTTDDVKLQYKHSDGKVYEKIFTSLQDLYNIVAAGSAIVLTEPVAEPETPSTNS